MGQQTGRAVGDRGQTQLLERGIAARGGIGEYGVCTQHARTARVLGLGGEAHIFMCGQASVNRGDLKRARDAELADFVR